jgi:hypothetical protein
VAPAGVAAPAAILLVALLLTGAGLVGFRRRDLLSG